MLASLRKFYRDLLLLMSGPTRRRFFVAIVGSVVTALADAAGVFAILPLMQLLTGSPQDEGVLGAVSAFLGNPPPTQLAIYLAVFTFGAFAFKGIATIIYKWWLLGFLSEQEAETSERLLRYYLAAPYGLHLRRNSADLLRTLNDAVRNVYTVQVIVGVVNIISELFTILAVATVLMVLIPGPAILLIAYFALAGAFLYLIVRPITSRAGKQMLASYPIIYQTAMQALGGIKEIKVRHKEEFFLRAYRVGRNQYADAQRLALFFGELPRYILEIIFIFGIGLTTVFVFISSPSSESIAVLAILAASGFRLLPSTVRMISAMNTVRFGMASFELVVSEIKDEQALRFSPQVLSRSTGARLQLERSIGIEQITFCHDGQLVPAVKNVSFQVPSGTAIALVGSSGAGKTTLVDLLLGLQTPDSGRISVDGQDIAEVMPEWQLSLGLVPQEVYLLDASLRENIAFGDLPEEIDDTRLTEAIVAAQLEDFVAGLPSGLNTEVGERGVRLSGGQRQRIGIARALYSQPILLLLDEATSALDNHTEQLIAETIKTLRGKVTILIVAHRLSTVRDCDQIVFLHAGEVMSVGTFEELERSNKDFAHLVRLGRL